MVKIAEDFSQDFKVKFNGAKSQFLIFSAAKNLPSVDIMVEGTIVTSSMSALHLGHKVFCDPCQDDLDSVIGSFHRQFNLFVSRFANVPPTVKCRLFNTYCTSFYGIQLCNLNKVHKLHVAYRKNLRRLLQLPYRTHCQLIPSLADSLCTDHMFIKRFLKFAAAGLNHSFPVVKFLLRNSLNLVGSLFATNCRYSKFKCDVHIPGNAQEHSHLVRSKCQTECKSDVNSATAVAIKDLLNCKYSNFECGLSYNEIDELLNFLCVN